MKHDGRNKQYIAVDVRGHAKPLVFDPGPTGCGDIKDGVAFEFGDEGWWVISLSEMKRLVAIADEARRNQS